MTTNHTPEPWYVANGTSIHDRLTEFDASGARIGNTPNQIAETYLMPFQTAESNARRIVACVNACSGIDTEALELVPSSVKGILVERSAERDRLREINAELLAALRRLMNAFEADAATWPDMPVFSSCETNSAAIAEARDAIKKAESWKP